MNLERIKSVVLVGLVASSMALTFQLFAIEPQKVIDATEQIEISDKIDDKIKDLISPKRIVVNYSEQNHRVFYSDFGVDLWKNTRDLFQNSFFNKEFQIKELDIDSYVDMLSKKSIVYNFGTEIPIDIFFKMNNDDVSEEFKNSIDYIDTIYIDLASEKTMILKNGEKMIQVPIAVASLEPLVEMVDQIKEKDNIKYGTGKLISASPEVLVPINLEETKTTIYVSNDIEVDRIGKIESIVEAFFGDVETARKIEENDGSLIYMYDKKGLVFTDDGVLKYFDEIEAPVDERSLYRSLASYANFLSLYDYSPAYDKRADMYLADIEPIESGDNKGYRLSFNYRINQKDVILDENFSDELKRPIEVEVYNDYIKSYKRYYRRTASVDSLGSFSFSIDYIMAPLDVINQNLEPIRNGYRIDNDLSLEAMKSIENQKILSTITSIESAYYDYCEQDSQAKLVEIWMIDFGKRRYIFNAYSGELIKTYRKE
ncbi:MAG: hypothetical protein N4A40_06920 [Tissierellales bacterium]|nr:hypothetical protein [Tissierellales bacterium]